MSKLVAVTMTLGSLIAISSAVVPVTIPSSSIAYAQNQGGQGGNNNNQGGTPIRVPEPGTLLLVGSGVAGLGGFILRRHYRRK